MKKPQIKKSRRKTFQEKTTAGQSLKLIYKNMKKFNSISSVFFLSMLGLFTVISCTNEESGTIESDFSKSSRLGVGTEVIDYLNNFYGQSFHYGDSIQTSDDGIDYLVTEVVLDTDTRARGYLATDIATNKFLYFVDVDRVNYKLFTDNIIENERKIFENIDRLSDYPSTNEFDFIFINSQNNNNSSNSGRFWGWSCGREYSIEPGSCYRNCVYYVLGMATAIELSPYPSPVFSCGELPGSNPKLN